MSTKPLMRALTGISRDVETIPEDARLAPDHPIVKAHPQLFAPADLDDHEIDRRKRALRAEADAAAAGPAPRDEALTFKVLGKAVVSANGRVYRQDEEFVLSGPAAQEFAASQRGVSVELVRSRLRRGA